MIRYPNFRKVPYHTLNPSPDEAVRGLQSFNEFNHVFLACSWPPNPKNLLGLGLGGLRDRLSRGSQRSLLSDKHYNSP